MKSLRVTQICSRDGVCQRAGGERERRGRTHSPSFPHQGRAREGRAAAPRARARRAACRCRCRAPSPTRCGRAPPRPPPKTLPLAPRFVVCVADDAAAGAGGWAVWALRVGANGEGPTAASQASKSKRRVGGADGGHAGAAGASGVPSGRWRLERGACVGRTARAARGEGCMDEPSFFC